MPLRPLSQAPPTLLLALVMGAQAVLGSDLGSLPATLGGAAPESAGSSRSQGPLVQAYQEREALLARLEHLDQVIGKLKAAHGRHQNANYLSIVGLQLERLLPERSGANRDLNALDDRIRDLETGRPASAAPASADAKGDFKAGDLPQLGQDPFFSITPRSVPGEVQRRPVKAARLNPKSVPTHLAVGHAGSVAYLIEEERTWGALNPKPGLTDAFQYPAKHLRGYFGLCADQRNTYYGLYTPSGPMLAILDVRQRAPLRIVPNPQFNEQPLGMVGLDNIVYLISPNQVLGMVPKADEVGADGFLSKRTKGSPLKPGTRFLAVDNRIYFLEPGTAVYGRLLDPILEDKVPMTIERFQLPEGARATAIASGPRGGDGKAGAGLLYVTDADQDRIYCIRTEDMRAQPIQLVAGTRPGAMAEGPMGTLVFATAKGFGVLTPDGAVRQVKLVGSPKVKPTTLASDPAQGKVFFLDPPNPGIAVLSLCALDTRADGVRLTCGDALDGPSLLADPPKGKSEAQRQRDRAKKARQKAKARTAGSTAPASVAAAPASAAVRGPGAAAPSIPGLETAADDEEEELDSSGTEDPGTESDEAAEAAPEPDNGLLFRRNISRERYEHVVEEHAHTDGPDPDPHGPAKDQFSAEYTQQHLGTLRRFKTFVRSVLRSGVRTRYEFQNGGADLVLEFAWNENVGRTWRPADGTWAATSRLRLALGLNEAGEFFLMSCYPISGAPAQEGKQTH